MSTKIIFRADAERASIGAGSILVVILLSLLFAAALLAAMRPQAVRNVAQASVEGGL